MINLAENVQLEVQIEFSQFGCKFKFLNEIGIKKHLNDNVLIAILISFTARYFFICDDRQFSPIKEYLNELFSSDFKNRDELYLLGVSKNIFEIIKDTFSEKERDALLNLFGKGYLLPFNSPPVLLYGEDAYEDDKKPFTKYRFIIKFNNNKVFYKFKMPLFPNPTNVFVPLTLAYFIEYVYLNLKSEESFATSKQLVLELLSEIKTHNFIEYSLINKVLNRDFKRRVFFGDFIVEICKNIVTLPEFSYKDYLRSDSEGTLSETEYKSFNDELTLFYFLLIRAMLLDKKIDIKLKNNNYTFEGIFDQAIIGALYNNGLDEKNIEKMYQIIKMEIDKFLEYISNIDPKSIYENGFVYHCCMYFSLKHIKNYYFDSGKESIIACFVKNHRDFINNYFEEAYSEVELTF